MKASYKISEISALYNICPDSLRYYEEKGILSPRRDKNGYRLYGITDIWKLNVLKDLRLLDFSTERIKNYLDHRSVEETLHLLNEEARLIDEKIFQLEIMGQNIIKRTKAIEEALAQTRGQIQIKDYQQRRCRRIEENVSLDGEVDFLIKKLQKDHEQSLYIIGNSSIGAFLDKAYWQKGVYNQYSAVFILDDSGDDTIEAGQYLAITYQGGYEQGAYYWSKLLAYAQEKELMLKGDLLELYHIDIHETSSSDEFLTELQVLVSQGEEK